MVDTIDTAASTNTVLDDAAKELEYSKQFAELKLQSENTSKSIAELKDAFKTLFVKVNSTDAPESMKPKELTTQEICDHAHAKIEEFLMKQWGVKQ